MFTVSCPSCSATYQLDEAKIGPQGRKLKCARCGHIWVAMAPAAVETPVFAPVAQEIVAAPVVAAAPDVSAQPEVAAADVSTEAANAAGEPEVSFTPKVVEVEVVATVGRYPWSRWLIGERKWVVVAVAVCVLGVGGALWALLGKSSTPHEEVNSEEHVSQVSPSTPVVVPAPQGVVLQRVKAQFTKVGEGIVLNVSGAMKNTSESTVTLPQLQVELLGPDGKVQDAWPVQLTSTTLLPTQEIPWGVSFTNPAVKAIAGWRAVFVQ